MCKREEGESFVEYKVRRLVENRVTKAYLRGTIVYQGKTVVDRYGKVVAKGRGPYEKTA